MSAPDRAPEEPSGPSSVMRRTFSSLAVRNYRLYFLAQLISLSGTWMQVVGQAWLVVDRLKGGGTALGFVTGLQFVPVLLFGPMGGVIADRVDKRRLLYFTQATSALLALALGLLVVTDVVRLWMVYALAAGLGFVNTVDNPSRQTFVLEMVGAERLVNAVTLNSVMVNGARAVGPAIAGVLIASVGLATCFFVNAASFVSVLVALAMMSGAELRTVPPQPRRKGQLREGLRYVRATPELLVPLLIMAVIGTLAFEFQVILPLLDKFTFHGGAGTFGLIYGVFGIGAVVGGLFTASRRSPEPIDLAYAALIFGGVELLAAVAPSLGAEFVALMVTGAASIFFLAIGNTTLQLSTADEMRGRVMGLWAVAFLGSTPIGAPIVGLVGQHLGPRYGLALGACASLVAGSLGYAPLARIARQRAGDKGLGEEEADTAS